jgi:5-methylcytosine-specific restriction endonuclease McrA
VSDPDAVREESALTPPEIRAAVLERDGRCCRICGAWQASPALHHIQYRSGGGADTVANLITLCWLPGSADCHLRRAHANKRLWQPILEQLVLTPGVTGLQWLRWVRRR